MTEEQYRQMTGQPAKTNKYHAKRVTVDGIKFASQRECDRWFVLVNMQRAGLISDLKRQVRFQLTKSITYIADATYVEDGKLIVEDSKGYRTKEYKLKKKLMKELGYDIKEV